VNTSAVFLGIAFGHPWTSPQYVGDPKACSHQTMFGMQEENTALYEYVSNTCAVFLGIVCGQPWQDFRRSTVVTPRPVAIRHVRIHEKQPEATARETLRDEGNPGSVPESSMSWTWCPNPRKLNGVQYVTVGVS